MVMLGATPMVSFVVLLCHCVFFSIGTVDPSKADTAPAGDSATIKKQLLAFPCKNPLQDLHKCRFQQILTELILFFH